VPEKYRQLFIDAGKTCSGISAQLLAAQAKVESINFDPAVVSGKRLSPAGAQGISQFMPGTWKTWGKGSPFNPADAVPAQARYMCHLIEHMPGKTPTNALAAYNAGPAAVKKYGGVPPYAETKNYVKRIEQITRELW
jgi:soluble lytic murein transglycosylase-like protein